MRIVNQLLVKMNCCFFFFLKFITLRAHSKIVKALKRDGEKKTRNSELIFCLHLFNVYKYGMDNSKRTSINFNNVKSMRTVKFIVPIIRVQC